jgi:hypothetical protein
LGMKKLILDQLLLNYPLTSVSPEASEEQKDFFHKPLRSIENNYEKRNFPILPTLRDWLTPNFPRNKIRKPKTLPLTFFQKLE